MRRIVLGMVFGLGLAAASASAGCAKSENESLDALLKQTGQSRADVYPLAGKVTLDGQPPHFAFPQRLVVMLYDPAKPDLPANRRPCRECNDAGEFSFGTYAPSDGIRAGTFVATFAVLTITPQGLRGPDELKNLYNDPDKNAQVPEFHIVHQAPGRTDYHFDLKVADQQPPESPGPKALTELRPGN